jgi:hypothetical protein
MTDVPQTQIDEIAGGIKAIQEDQTRRNIERDIRGAGVFTEEERAEVKTLVNEALVEFFRGYGLRGRNTIVTAGLIIGSLVVILGGIKTVLGWIGFNYVMR